MEQNKTRPMTPFDNLVTPPYLYTLKLLLPYMPLTNQRFLGIYIKFLELRHAMENFNGFPASGSFASSGHASPFGMFEDLKPYMSPGERDMMDQMSGMMGMMEMMKAMQASAGDDGSANEGGDSSFGGFNPMDMMMGMLDPEQQEMLKTYSSMFDSGTDDSE